MTEQEYYITRSLATAAAAIEQGFTQAQSKTIDIIHRHINQSHPAPELDEIVIREGEWCDGFRTHYKHLYEAIERRCCAWRFPKTPHNVALMEVKEGDLLRIYFFTPEQDNAVNAAMTGVALNNQEAKTWFRNKDDGSIDNEIHILGFHHWEVIHRNNKPFPVWDKEEV